MYLPLPNYDHLLGLIDDTGIFEHSRYGVPRREHGYTTDDAARAIVVLCAGPNHEPHVRALRVLLAFLLHSLTPKGRFHNRLSFERRWVDDAESDDTQGRAIWALSVAATEAPRPELRDAAVSVLREVPRLSSPHLRPYAYAALGAHALWSADPGDPIIMRLLDPVVERFDQLPRPWPEPRLAYANGRIPSAMLVMGEITGRSDLTDAGLSSLAWLVEAETRGDHLSFAPVGGWSPGEPRPGFDQQPIEADALAEAAERAWRWTDDPTWQETVNRAGAWLMGQNDAEVPLYDAATGTTRDGLMESGVNANNGAESTIAGLSVLQTCHRIRVGQLPLAESGTKATLER